MNRAWIFTLGVAAAAACTPSLPEKEIAGRAEKMFQNAFSRGNPELAARVFTQDEVQLQCSRYHNEPPPGIAEEIRKSQAATLEYPPSGKLMGDWREGEKIAQSGKGMRFTDTGKPGHPNGGNCYACHRLAPQELSYGTLGPSLRQFGKQRGTDEATQRYVYGKIYNAQASAACTGMPRFGYNKILTPQQITHLVALLLDPESPVNR